MGDYIPGIVYNNLVKLLVYRDMVLQGKPLSGDEVAHELNHNEYVTIDAVRERDIDAWYGANLTPSRIRRGTLTIALIAPASRYASKKANFDRLLLVLQKKKAERIMLVSETLLTKHIQKQFMGELTAAGTEIEFYDYKIFEITIPKHESVPLHTIPTKAEVDYICRIYCTLPEYFPKIISADPMAIWLGLMPGMVVRTDGPSETAGKVTSYMYCVR
jgi:DNA-directed RNA polymerase subunit H (RpoH/RPB5)